MTIDIEDLRKRHANSILNTATGRALGAALDELETRKMTEARDEKTGGESGSVVPPCSADTCATCLHYEEGPQIVGESWCHYCNEATEPNMTCDWHETTRQCTCPELDGCLVRGSSCPVHGLPDAAW